MKPRAALRCVTSVERAPAAPTGTLPASAAGPLSRDATFRALLEAAAETVLALHRDTLARDVAPRDARPRAGTEASPPLATWPCGLDVSSRNLAPAADGRNSAAEVFSGGRA